MILIDYVKGDIKINRKSYISSIITIFLAVIILSTFIIGIYSYFNSFKDMIGNSTGGYHFRIVSKIDTKDAKNLLGNRYIKKVGFFNIEELSQEFGSKKKINLYKIDDNALVTIKSWLKEGQMPKHNQVIISDDMARKTSKNIGDNLLLKGNNYQISGIYTDMGYDFENYYNVFLNVEQEQLLREEDKVSPFIWYKNIYRTYNLSKEILDEIDENYLTYNFNTIYLNQYFIFDRDNDSIFDHSFQIMTLILLVILIILFYFIITSVFLVQESKFIKEYSRLKSIGATNKDINRIIKLKVIYISQIPIIMAILSSMGLVKFLFFLIYKVEKLFGAQNTYAITNNLKFKLDIKLIVVIYLISLIVIYLGSTKSFRKLKKTSILNGLKGDIKGKSYKRYDLKYSLNIESDLAKHFYKNGKKAFIFTNITLKLGFMLMVFIMTVISYFSLETKYNRINKYKKFDVQADYATNKEIDSEFLRKIKSLDIEELISFRKEGVYLDYDESIIDDSYIKSGALDRLRDEVVDLNNIKIEIYGIEDEKFSQLVSNEGFNPDEFIGNKVLLLNSIANDFNVSKSKLKYSEFLKGNTSCLNVSEYGQTLDNSGYKFDLDIESKIEKPLFEYPFRENRLNVYMKKSEYIKLFAKFLRIADLDQFEYILIDTKDIDKTYQELNKLSLDYFRNNDFNIVSKFEEDKNIKKSTIIGNILAIFFSIFFVVVGFANCYFSFYNLFLQRRKQMNLYKTVGMDKTLMSGILSRERNKILIRLVSTMPIILLGLVLVVAKSSKIFTLMDILKEINYFLIIGYVVLIYIVISNMYNNYKDKIY